MKPAVFLDRDGVLNRLVRRDGGLHSPRTVDQFVTSPDAARQVARLNAAGYMTLVVTNQPDVARRLMSGRAMKEMNLILRREVPVNQVLVCPHDDDDECTCRKPQPGMLTEAARRWQLDLPQSFMIGDSWKDMEAAKAAGVTSVLIDADYNQDVTCDHRAADLNAAVNWILQQRK